MICSQIQSQDKCLISRVPSVPTHTSQAVLHDAAHAGLSSASVAPRQVRSPIAFTCGVSGMEIVSSLYILQRALEVKSGDALRHLASGTGHRCDDSIHMHSRKEDVN